MPNPLLHIRVSPEGQVLLREARIRAMRERKTLGAWLTELLRENFNEQPQQGQQNRGSEGKGRIK